MRPPSPLAITFPITLVFRPHTFVVRLWHELGLSPRPNPAIVKPLSSPSVAMHFVGGPTMRFLNLCYAAVGFALARWVFRRESVRVADPVARFRSAGLM